MPHCVSVAPAAACVLFTLHQALSWTLYELLQHPKVEQQLLQELREVLGPLPAGSSSSRQAVHPSYEQVQQLRYTRACYLEALRLHPSVPQVRHACQALRLLGLAIAELPAVYEAAKGDLVDIAQQSTADVVEGCHYMCGVAGRVSQCSAC
jgi:hypothetical protein